MTELVFWAFLYLAGCIYIGKYIGNNYYDIELAVKIAWCHMMVAMSFGNASYTIVVTRHGKVTKEIVIGSSR